MLAVACAHLGIKDSQFDLKGNCTLLLLHKEQLRSRAATETGLRRAEKTLSIVSTLVCKTAAARNGKPKLITPYHCRVLHSLAAQRASGDVTAIPRRF